MDELKIKQYLREISEGNGMSLKEVANRLNVTVWSVRNFVRDGKLDAMKVGRGYLVPQSALYAYIRGKVKPNFDAAEKLDQADMFIPTTMDDEENDDYLKHLATLQSDDEPQADVEPEPEPEPEPDPDEVEAERFEQYRPRPTSFSDGFFG